MLKYHLWNFIDNKEQVYAFGLIFLWSWVINESYWININIICLKLNELNLHLARYRYLRVVSNFRLVMLYTHRSEKFKIVLCVSYYAHDSTVSLKFNDVFCLVEK